MKLSSDEVDAFELAKELDGLALALEQAAGYIDTMRISFADYLVKWRSHEPKVQEWHHARRMQYPRSVAVTWQTTVDQLSADARLLLNLLAWFSPDPIPLFVFEDYVTLSAALQANLPGVLEDTTWTEERLRAALGVLTAFNLIRWNTEKKTVSVHRVAQEILRNKQDVARAFWLSLFDWLLPKEKRRERTFDQKRFLNAVLALINSAIAEREPIDIRFWPVWEQTFTHISFVVDQAYSRRIVEPTSDLMRGLGMLLYAKAMPNEAEPLMRRVLEIGERHYAADSPQITPDLNNLGALFQSVGRLSESELLIRRALAIVEHSSGSDNPEVANMLNNLGMLLEETGRFQVAELLMRRALVINEQFFDGDHPFLARVLNNIGLMLQATDRLPEAELLLRRAIAIHEISGGPITSNATSINNLALVLRHLKQFTEAEALLRYAIRTFESALGPEHPKVGLSVVSISAVLRETNRLAEAEPLMRRAFEIFSRTTMQVRDLKDSIHTDFQQLLTEMEMEPREVAERFSSSKEVAESGAPFTPIAPYVERLLGPATPVSDVLAQLDLKYRAAGEPFASILRLDEPVSPILEQLLGPTIIDVVLEKPISPYLDELLGEPNPNIPLNEPISLYLKKLIEQQAKSA